MVDAIEVWCIWDREDGTPTLAGYWKHNYEATRSSLERVANLFVTRSERAACAELKRRRKLIGGAS